MHNYTYYSSGPLHQVGGGAPDWALALFAFLGPLVIIVVLWSIFWKGLALWHSARREHHWWFIAMLIINTAGILEIIYLFGIIKLKLNQLFSTYLPHDHAHHEGHSHTH